LNEWFKGKKNYTKNWGFLGGNKKIGGIVDIE